MCSYHQGLETKQGLHNPEDNSATFEFLLLYPFPKWQILDFSKLKEFADDNFWFGENGEKFSNWVENTLGKEIAHFLTVFTKDLYCRQQQTGKGLTHYHTMPHFDAL